VKVTFRGSNCSYAENNPTQEDILNEWGPWKSWWMDLVKFCLTFGAGAVITVFVLNGIEAKQAAQRVRCQTIIDSKITTLSEFTKSSLIYNEAAYDAWTELYRWREREMTPAMRRYTEDSHENLTIALENVKHRFNEYESVIETLKEFENATYTLWKLYDGFVDLRLDKMETEEFVSQVPRNQLQEQRDVFNKYREEVSRIRSILINKLEKILFKSNYEELCREINIST